MQWDTYIGKGKEGGGGAVIVDVSGKCGLVGEILLENWDGGRVGEIILF